MEIHSLHQTTDSKIPMVKKNETSILDGKKRPTKVLWNQTDCLHSLKKKMMLLNLRKRDFNDSNSKLWINI